jgi:MYXO-CTERM domain-containing protein
VDGGADADGSGAWDGGGEAAMHNFRAQGGACSCAFGEATPSAAPLAVFVVLAGGWARARRRRAR